MSTRTIRQSVFTILLACLITAASTLMAVERGFTSLFDGKTLKGWTLQGKKGDGYLVKDGMIVCARGGGGNLLSEKEYGDFVLRLDYRVEAGGNNGVGIRAPLSDKLIAYQGMEIQVLDDNDPKYANLQPWQFCGSVYGVVPAVRGAIKPANQWNKMEISAIGRRVKVTLNGRVIVNSDLNTVTDHDLLEAHPGILRSRGRIGFLGHDDQVEFRDIRIKEIPTVLLDNHAPGGFRELFNGVDLTGWRGLLNPPYDNPYQRKELSLDQFAEKQLAANIRMRQDWRVNKGMISYTGSSFNNLQTEWDYGNFEMLVDWRIGPDADSGIYLRGSPQVQIWDNFGTDLKTRVGSGGLFNNTTHSNVPNMRADRFTGEWNRYRILMLNERVIVWLNDELVVYDGKRGVTLENYWNRELPVLPLGPIELQAHKTPVQFKNIFIREIP